MFFYEKREEISRSLFSIEEGFNYSYPLHIHRWYELIGNRSGELDIDIDGTTYTLGKNDSLFIFPNQTHQLISHGNSHHKLVLIKPELIAHFNSKAQNMLPVCPKKHIESGPWLEIFMGTKKTSSIEEMKGILYLYCSFWTPDEFRTFSDGDMPDNLDLMHRIFRFAADHFTESCTLSDLSANIGYDYSYLSKLFSEKIGISFTEYVNMLRIDRACYLLKNTDLPVIDISEQCGYGSLRSFNRNFVKRTGYAPRDYKRSPVEHEGDKRNA